MEMAVEKRNTVKASGTEENTTKQYLLQAGIREIRKYGLSNMSMRRVALNCELSCATPYKHFKNKDELINYIIQPALNRINKIIYKHTNQTIDLNNPNFDLSKLYLR
jgi:AcrR family transcriptional regulator